MARLPHAFPEIPITPVLCSPGSRSNIAEVCGDYTPQIIIHNATRKYLPFFPFQVESIIRANYLLTFTLAKYAVRHGCERFILVSSEEAEKRGNLIADSLRVVEIGLRQFFAAHQTCLVIARLCDIMENRGSVIARLEEQIHNQETITLPHRAAQCTFLSKHAAAHFILGTLLQVERLLPAEGIFVCPHSTTLLQLDIVQRLAMLKGLQVGRDISVRFHDQNSHHGPVPSPPPALRQGTLVTTTNAGISLLQEPPLLASPKSTAAVQALLDMQEHDVDHSRWEPPTRTLLFLGTPPHSESHTATVAS
jgi:FlaA1/EpsC-like NDP-sugar epimerase